MKRIFNLVKVMSKASSENLLAVNKKTKIKTGSKLGMLLIYAILVVYIAGFVGFFSYLVINNLASIGQEGLSFQFLFLALNAFIIITTLIVTPTVLYFSKDVENYLVMPLKPWEIMISKFFTSLLFSYLTTLVVMLPFIVMYVYLLGFNLLTVLMYMLTFILIPIFPSSLISIIIILIFTFAPFVKNKDIFTYFTMFITVVFSLSLSLTSKLENIDANSLANLLNSGDNSLLSVIQSPFNPSTQFAKAIINHDLLALIIGVLIALSLLIILGFIGQALYFKGAIGISEMSSKKKNLSLKDSKKLTQSKSQTVSLALQDWRKILRTPILLTNYYMGVILLPILLIIPIIVEGDLSEVLLFIETIKELIKTVDTVFLTKLFILFGLVFGFSLTSFSSLASTSFSREGTNMQFLNSMPISIQTLYHSKLIVSIATLSIIPLIFGLVAGILLNINTVLIIIMSLSIIAGSVFSSLLGCIFDIIAPKLVWETEQQAVKQNFVSMIAMFVQMGFMGLMGYLIFKLTFDQSFILILGVCISLSIALYFISRQLLDKVLLNKVESI